jgi:hypothetical protein
MILKKGNIWEHTILIAVIVEKQVRENQQADQHSRKSKHPHLKFSWAELSQNRIM